MPAAAKVVSIALSTTGETFHGFPSSTFSKRLSVVAPMLASLASRSCDQLRSALAARIFSGDKLIATR